MRNDLRVWNSDVDFHHMFRLNYRQIKNLNVGDHVYYVNMNDDIIGAVYDAEIISKTDYQLILRCQLVEGTATAQMFNDTVYEHTEGFAFTDICADSLQMLFANFAFKEDNNE